MTPRTYKVSWLTVGLACLTLVAQAQTDYYKTNNNDSLELATSWTNGVVTGLAPGAPDTAIWDAQVSTAANCANTLASGGASWAGIKILNPAAAVKVTSSGTINIGSLGIDLNQPTSSRDLWLASSLATQADQNWAVGAGLTLTLGDTSRNDYINNNVALAGHLVYVNTVRIQNGGVLNIPAGATIDTSGSTVAGAQVSVGYSGSGAVNQTGGTVSLKRTDGTTGSPKTSLAIANSASSSGVYTITGGALLDVSTVGVGGALGGGRFDVGAGSGATGTLNLGGTACVQAQNRVQVGNVGNGIINVTNGTLSIMGDLRLGIGAADTGALNVYGGTVYVGANLNVPHGGTATVDISGGDVFANTLNLPNAATTGTLTISGGTLTCTNSLGFASTGTGTANLNGGTLMVPSMSRPSTAIATVNFNGGTLKARAGSLNFIANGITANVNAGGAKLDTAGFSPTIPAALLNGGGTDGGLTKLGLGLLTLSGANTYTGPTVVNGGGLSLTTTNHGGGSIVLNNTSLLHVTVGGAGTTLNSSSLALGSLGASSGGVLTNEFDLNGFASTSFPVVHATSLTATGMVYVSVIGSGWSMTTYPLIKYNNATVGSDFAVTNLLISGAIGYVTNNTSTRSVNLVITALPNLVWRAQVNTNWDTTTANWVDLSTSLQTAYPNGASVFFNDSTSNGLVYVTAEYSPAAMAINNPATNYTFTGAGRIRGTTGLIKTGAAMVTMGLTNNDYSGDTVLSNGTFRLATSGVIPDGTGKGNVTLEGKLDLAGFNEAINGLSGSSGIVDNSGATPVTFTVGNGAGSGTFAGQITNSGSSTLALTKAGAGTLVLLSKNGYSGDTTVGGTLQLAYEQSIGTGPLSLGGTLLWTDTAAHTLTNPLTLTGSSTFGADTNGPLTVPGIVNFAGGGRALTCNTDVLFQNGMTNGGLTTKAGPGTLTIKNNGGDWASGSLGIQGGSLILDNAAAIQDGNNVRVQCSVPDGTARLVITNGGSLTTSNSASSNFRVGDLAAAGTYNILDLAGTVNVLPYSSPNTGDKFQLGGPGAQDSVNLLPGGMLRARQVAKSGGSLSTAIFNFNGGALSPNTNDFAASFMTGLDYCYILDGGAIIDTAGWNVTIGQQLLAGGTGIGGLTKNGAGTLTLNYILWGYYSTYSGPTIINAGTLALGVNEPLYYSTNVIVGTNATLDISAGSFMLTGRTLTLQIAKQGATLSSGLVTAGAGTVSYDGELTVARTGDALTGGETFKLFDAAAGYYLAFTATNLPPLTAPLSWDVSGLYVDGTIKVTGSIARPSFGSVQLQGGTNIVLSGSGGTAGGTYHVLSQTNVALPLSLWTPIATNVFSTDGKFTNSIPVDPAKHQSYFDILLQ